jgi:hypothetical protein
MSQKAGIEGRTPERGAPPPKYAAASGVPGVQPPMPPGFGGGGQVMQVPDAFPMAVAAAPHAAWGDPTVVAHYQVLRYSEWSHPIVHAGNWTAQIYTFTAAAGVGPGGRLHAGNHMGPVLLNLDRTSGRSLAQGGQPSSLSCAEAQVL